MWTIWTIILCPIDKRLNTYRRPCNICAKTIKLLNAQSVSPQFPKLSQIFFGDKIFNSCESWNMNFPRAKHTYSFDRCICQTPSKHISKLFMYRCNSKNFNSREFSSVPRAPRRSQIASRGREFKSRRLFRWTHASSDKTPRFYAQSYLYFLGRADRARFISGQGKDVDLRSRTVL